MERIAREAGPDLYVASLSFSTVVYKALCAADQLAAFYPELVWFSVHFWSETVLAFAWSAVCTGW